jgi:hypothetical protein
MTNHGADTGKLQSITFDEFMYFFLRLRKSRIRAVVENVRRQFPEESREQLARRIIDAHSPISFLGGSLLYVVNLVPGLGLPLQTLGVVMGGSALTRMHLYMILEIALLYGRDIDDQARVSELMAVVAATSASVAAPYVVNALDLTPLVTLPVAAITATTTTQLIGNMAIRHYGEGETLPETSSAAEVLS